MALVQWNPWTELETFKHHFNRLFDTPMSNPFGNGDSALWMPRLDIQETDSAYVVEADLPGMAIEDIDVQIDGTTLSITGERKAEKTHEAGSATHSERVFGRFRRVFTLPAAVKVDEVDAKYTNGVLTVTVPKSEAARTKRIAIQAA